MCGIVGYVGSRIAQEFLIEGLRRLEYRGYDSAGVATLDENQRLNVTKSVGRIASLANEINKAPCTSNIGIGHTRWATHGAATVSNAHPHIGGEDFVAIAHNGVIENYAELRAMLKQKGYQFHSETDTEVIAHLLAECNKDKSDAVQNSSSQYQNALDTVRETINYLRGTFGLAIVFRHIPDAIFAARLGSPLVVGIGDGEHFLASDASPLIGFTEKIVYLSDHQVAMLTSDGLQVSHRDQGIVEHSIKKLEAESNQIDLGEYEHYMLKEIFEQPESLKTRCAAD